jgi:crotonobetainyl-CoA:carnitine CoA-transferase CaiB-like acyl-CoA transferase
MLPAHRLPPSPGASFSMLEGIRVLDLTTSIAGPYATLLLGDLGAEVLKVERPGSGDDSRAWGPPFLDGESLWFLSVNRNKRSITLDYGAEAGRRLLRALIERVDVLVVNQMASVQDKLGVSWDAVSMYRPNLIHVSVTGFGSTGARRDLPCYDLVAEGYSGVMDLTGELPGAPQKVGAPAADLVAGMDAALATVAAIFDRQRTGRGHRIDISMVESMTRFMSPRLVPYLGSGEVARRSGAKDSVIAVYQVFDAADLPLTLGLGNDTIWKRFWAAVGHPERGEDPRHRTNVDRRAARAEIVAEIQAILSTRPRAEWLRIFAEARVPAGPINRLDEVAADPALAERGFLFSLPGREHPIPQVGLGIRVDGRAAGANLPPPRLGEHTAQVLREWAGCDDQQLAALRADGII